MLLNLQILPAMLCDSNIKIFHLLETVRNKIDEYAKIGSTQSVKTKEVAENERKLFSSIGERKKLLLYDKEDGLEKISKHFAIAMKKTTRFELPDRFDKILCLFDFNKF